jgi:serine/threonine protein kinase
MVSLIHTVLYSCRDRAWKIADFGFASAGSSTGYHGSSKGRGTGGYRPPELLSEEAPVFNKTLDIWALGCILFELAVGTKPFPDDFSVFEYKTQAQLLPATTFPVPLDSRYDALSAASITEHVTRMLEISLGKRPSASQLYGEFCQYQQRIIVGIDLSNSLTQVAHVHSSDLHFQKIDILDRNRYCSIPSLQLLEAPQVEWPHPEEKIIETLGRDLEEFIHSRVEVVLQMEYSRLLVRLARLIYVFSIPNNWNDQVRNCFLQGALKAGIPCDNFSFIEGSKATAIGCLDADRQEHITQGSAFIICRVHADRVV